MSELENLLRSTLHDPRWDLKAPDGFEREVHRGAARRHKARVSAGAGALAGAVLMVAVGVTLFGDASSPAPVPDSLIGSPKPVASEPTSPEQNAAERLRVGEFELPLPAGLSVASQEGDPVSFVLLRADGVRLEITRTRNQLSYGFDREPLDIEGRQARLAEGEGGRPTFLQVLVDDGSLVFTGSGLSTEELLGIARTAAVSR